jgi:hypothetical protein
MLSSHVRANSQRIVNGKAGLLVQPSERPLHEIAVALRSLEPAIG